MRGWGWGGGAQARVGWGGGTQNCVRVPNPSSGGHHEPRMKQLEFVPSGKLTHRRVVYVVFLGGLSYLVFYAHSGCGCVCIN